MTEDLLTRIQREMSERLRELRGAVDEYNRLQGELSALDTEPEPPAEVEPPAALSVVPEPLAAPESAAPPANVVRLPVRPRVPRTRMVSPKIARLMLAPRRPALERPGVVRVGAGGVGASPEDNPWPQETGEEVDADAEVYGLAA